MRTDLQKAIDALEDAGFHVNRAYQETNRDAGNVSLAYQQDFTDAICLRATPVKGKEKQG
jgi:hypothetical protein